MARPVQGIVRVINPVATGGGADADRVEDIRRNAPLGALVLLHAVSIHDFCALARQFGGVKNVHVQWAWDERRQRAAVLVWFISDGGDIADELQTFLIGRADPNTPLTATEATAMSATLTIELSVSRRYEADAQVERVREALENSETGLLAKTNVPIGSALFRSQIFEAVMHVPGIESVQSITLNGSPAPFALTVSGGEFLDFSDGLTVRARFSDLGRPEGSLVWEDAR